MSNSDELDRRRAKDFAWRFARPGDAVVLPDDAIYTEETGPHYTETAQGHPPAQDQAAAPATDQAAPDDPDGKDSQGGQVAAVGQAEAAAPAADKTASYQAFFTESRTECAVLAVEIERIWLWPESEQAAALEPLLIRAVKLGLGLCGMQSFPAECIRMLRLALRHRKALSAEAWQAACISTTWLDYHDPGFIELLLEVARARSHSLADALRLGVSQDHWIEAARIPGAIARIVELIDHDPSYITQAIAATWISFTGGTEAVPALRRALRKPHFVLRYQALDVLCRCFPHLIQAEDVIFLVEDSVRHVAPPTSRSNEELMQAKFYLPPTLQGAIARLRPQGLIEPLLCLIEGRCTPRWGTNWDLDEPWALRMLALNFPEQALSHIDRRLADVSWEEREMATAAAECLPDALARPRLLLAAADAAPDIAEFAQTCWLERYGSPCPLDPMANVQTALLDGPPSEVMLSRLELLRRGPIEARAAMVEFLLGEAPEPEALVLLLFAVIDSRLWELRPRPGLPTSRNEVCGALIERFGARAVEGILELDVRYPEGRWNWLHTLFVQLIGNKIPEETYPALRTAAARRIANSAEEPDDSLLAILAHVGPPPALADRLWQIARDPAEVGYVRGAAIRALALLPQDKEGGHLDAAVQAEMEAALAVPDVARFALAAAVGIGRKLPEAIALTQRIFAEVGPRRPEPENIRWVTLLADCAEALLDAGHLPETWLVEALGRPGTYLAAIAARVLCYGKAEEPELDALEALLADDDPTCTAAAACALAGKGLLGKEHVNELLAMAERAPLFLRSELILRMWDRIASPSDLWPLMVPLLVSADPEVTEPMCALAHEFDKPELKDSLEALLPQIVDARLRQDINYHLKDEIYWMDTDADADE